METTEVQPETAVETAEVQLEAAVEAVEEQPEAAVENHRPVSRISTGLWQIRR